jgi:hypothetical protein
MASHRTLIAAAVTIAVLCGLAGFALGAGSGDREPATVTAKPKVRTQVMRRTVHVKRKRPAPATTRPAAPARSVSSAPTISSAPATSWAGDDDHDDRSGHGGGDDDHGDHGGDDDHSGHGGGDD